MSSVAVVIDKGRESKKGIPVKLRIIENRVKNFISLKVYLSEEEFNYIKIGKRLNDEQKYLQQKFIKAEFKASNILREMEEYSFQSFRELYDGKKPKEINTSIDSLFNTYIAELKENKKFGTASIYTNTIAIINKFKGGVKIDRIDPNFLKAFHKYLLGEGNSITTISLHQRCIRAILNRNKNLVKKYPFHDYKIPAPTNNKRSINPNDLKRILSYQFEDETDNFYLDIAKISFYLAGSNISDICKFKPSNINGDLLTYSRTKTNGQIKIFLIPEAKEIIKKYSGGKYLFPLITHEEPKYFYNKSRNVVKSVNLRLKKLCLELEIPKVCSYSLRHSYATIMMNKGVSIAFISQSLGHTNIATTQNYLGSFTDSQMEENMKKLI